MDSFLIGYTIRNELAVTLIQLEKSAGGPTNRSEPEKKTEENFSAQSAEIFSESAGPLAVYRGPGGGAAQFVQRRPPLVQLVPPLSNSSTNRPIRPPIVQLDIR